MSEKIKMLRVWRSDKFSKNIEYKVQISLYDSVLCIELFKIFNNNKVVEKRCAVYVYSYHTYIYAMSTLVAYGITLKLAKKIDVLLNNWYEMGYFSFPGEGEIIVDLSKLKNWKNR